MAEGWRKHEAKMQRIGGTDGVSFEDKEIWLHFFRLESDSHWIAAESNGRGLFFGCVVLDGDFENAEWGYFTIAGMGTAPGLMAMCRKAVKRFANVFMEVQKKVL